MNGRNVDLIDLVRQLRSELVWAQRIGYVDAPRSGRPAPALPVEPEPQVAVAAPRPEVPPRVAPPPPPKAPSIDPGPGHQGEASPFAARSLDEVRAELGDCTRCKLHGLGRKQIVFGVGNPKAELMFIGEGPGAQEDIQGIPFVGDAGQLLTKIIQAMGLSREEVYIANIVKCRPPQNRDPEPDEVASCEPFLKAQIAAIRPRMIVTLGKYASQTILRTSTPITRLRGQWGSYEGTPVMPTYHPAYLLRNPAEKRPVWSDMKAVIAALGKKLPERGADG
ncbi:MAG: uracil-DNA glycosylase [Myxococcota bacterium]